MNQKVNEGETDLFLDDELNNWLTKEASSQFVLKQ